MGHTPSGVDRLLIRTAAGQAGIGNNGRHIGSSALRLTAKASSEKGRTAVTDTNPDRST